jgi:hypothetical protein
LHYFLKLAILNTGGSKKPLFVFIDVKFSIIVVGGNDGGRVNRGF